MCGFFIRSWSNYTTCLDPTDFTFRKSINNLTTIGLTTSLTALILSLTILVSFPSLRCTRNNIHANMFLSMSLNNIFWLIWYHFVLNDSSVVSQNHLWCRGLQVITTYFMLTTYFWMLSEGLYLRILLLRTSARNESTQLPYLLVGWILPVLFVAIYGTFRHLYENELCWMETHDSIFLLAVPVACVISINIFLLCSVIKILRSKLQFENNFRRQQSDVALKSARAVLILIPIFGLHFILLPIRPLSGSDLEYFYEIFSCISTSTQGLSVSILLCFCNPDVWNMFRRRNHYVSITIVVSQIPFVTLHMRALRA